MKIGIMASQISGHLTVANSYESIATTTLSSTATSIVFSSIPATFQHLQVRINWAENSTNWLAMNFNSDTTGANYKTHELQGNGSSATSGVPTFTYGLGVSLSNTSNSVTSAVIDILDYKNTNKYKTARTLSGQDTNGAGIIQLLSGVWMSTAAISTLTLFTVSAFNIATNSSFALYGVK